MPVGPASLIALAWPNSSRACCRPWCDKDSTLCAVETWVVQCPFGCHPALGGSWVPAFAGKMRGWEGGGQEPRWRRCQSGRARGGGSPPARWSELGGFECPPRQRGPRSRGSAAATERTSPQRIFCWHGVRVLLKKRRPPCRGGCGGSMSFWLPPSARWFLGPGVRRENEG